MAKRSVIVSDFSGAEVDPREIVTITLRYADGRRGQVVADAGPNDDVVRLIAKKGRGQKRRGRKPAGVES